MAEPRASVVGWEERFDQIAAGVLVVVVVLNILNAFVIWQGDFDHEGYLWLLLDREGNAGTWVSSSILLAASAGALGCSFLDDPATRPFWDLTAVLLALMSFEEVAQLHELVSGNLSSAVDGAGLAAIWVLPGFALVVVLLVLLARRSRPVPTPVRRGLVLGAGLFVFGSLGMELLNELTAPEVRQVTRYLVITTIEENLELAGGLVLAHVCWQRLRRLTHSA